MTSSVSAKEAATEPTYYEILGLSPSILDTQQDVLKRAYHRALLRHHPDKAAAATSTATTIDSIKTAFTTLSNPTTRTIYDAQLRTSSSSSSSAPGLRDPAFQTGVADVDLDDLAFDAATARWWRACRCGNERGYDFSEADLEEASAAGEDAALLVGCQDCSLWLRVHFAVVFDDNDSDAEDEGPGEPPPPQPGG